MCIVMALELGLVQALVAAKEGEEEEEEEEVTADELARSTGSDRLLTGAVPSSSFYKSSKASSCPPCPCPCPCLHSYFEKQSASCAC